MLAIPVMAEIASLSDPALPPTLTMATRLDLTPAVLRHCMDVSDSHRDDSHPDHDTLTVPVYAASPIPSPRIVRLTDPVPTMLALPIALSSHPETDIASVTLPKRSPPVMESRRDDSPELLTKHLTQLSDTHDDASQLLNPPRPRNVWPLSPCIDPVTVTLDEPVPATELDACTRLTAAAPVDTASVRLPETTPTVSDSLRLPCAFCATLQRTVVSDTQPLASQLLKPDRADAVVSSRPLIAPSSVTVMLPVHPA